MFSTRILVTFFYALIPTIAFAHGGDEILSKNPQLSEIPDWPQRSSNTGSVGVPEDCNKCAHQNSLRNMNARGDTPYRCVFFEGKFGGEAWESGGGETKTFTLQLHPHSPIVWRVFPQGGYAFHAEKKLIAEFDIKGKMVFSKSARTDAVPEPRNITSTDCVRGDPYHEVAAANSPGKIPSSPEPNVGATSKDMPTQVNEKPSEDCTGLPLLKRTQCLAKKASSILQ